MATKITGTDTKWGPDRGREEVGKPPNGQRAALVRIKILHTAIWLFFASCILAIPVAGAMQSFALAATLIAVVLIECAVLALNRGVGPMTPIAARYTAERKDNFDIYLPLWLARHNKAIFGSLYVAGIVYVIFEWLRIRT